jgi:hypothetical protein
MTITEDDLLTALRRLHEKDIRQPGEFTTSEYAEINSITRGQARGELNRKAKGGEVERVAEQRFIQGCWQIVYRLVSHP